MPEVRGRADLLFGATVFEFKRDLRREIQDVERQLPLYLAEREGKTGRRFLGIATDGATFIAFELQQGKLVQIGRHETKSADGPALLAWLEPALSDRDDLHPDALRFRRELGRESLTYGRSRQALEQFWAEQGHHPEARLKRQLWDGLLREAYGSDVGDDRLFLQHTYLTIVAKTLAARVLDLPLSDAEALLSGRALAEAGIVGAVESDFFDWVLLHKDGPDLVIRIARQVARFRLREVEVDLLKVLYESLIDPEQRHDLGEYYTPDWLASKLVAAVLERPLEQRVLDPACGSGTFLFHVLRRLLAAAREAGWSDARALGHAAEHVRGLDVHPVAVIIARVTWLLALGEAIEAREDDLHVPVYLGDALQWNISRIGNMEEISVPVPDEHPLRIPAGFAADQALLEHGLQEIGDALQRMAEPEQVERALRRLPGLGPADAVAMTATYERIRHLKQSGRNGIWPYILRNLVRPLWLSREAQRADLVIGNPPWVAYRHLSADMKPRMKDACRDVGLWVGGNLATQQDLSALFWARAAERYLRLGGTIAFVLPYAALNRPAYEGLRRGTFGGATVQIVAAWGLELVRPLFPTSAAVVIGKRGKIGPPPEMIERFQGHLPKRDATEVEADRWITRAQAPWPPITTLAGASVYRARFKQGASISPRRFFLVEREPVGRLGGNRAAPSVRGKTGLLDKAPWKNIEPPSGPVETQFLRSLLLGENIAPYRLLAPALAVLPVEDRTILDGEAAARHGHRHLARWLRDIEAKWTLYASRGTDGKPRMTLLHQIDHMHKLSQQLARIGTRVVYTKAGTLISASRVEDYTMIVDTSAYWTITRSSDESSYLCSIVNSNFVLQRIIPMQPRGWRDPRHFDNLVWELPIPEFDGNATLHRELAEAGEAATYAAAEVVLPEGDFRRKRRAIRDALADLGISQRIDALVGRLLAE